ncbi:EF-hand domain-containing protein [Salinicola aestuarinus]|uniref:EF-hand domain-containing protein n=1 Tax=Salinicola aestuarinus TaxID=1949082 RepID=UPI000DA15386|nr:EF-hand domain-containing protein [Salinicola aestuarinus]
MSDERQRASARQGRGSGWPLLPMALLLAGCAGQSTDRDVVVERPSSERPVEISANATFSAADRDADGYLSPTELEPLGLGGNWHTLDLDGSGRLSPREFRQAFGTPLVQATMMLPSDARESRPTVSDDYRLPPLTPEQDYRPGPVTGLTPTSFSLPPAVPVLVPVLINDEDAANIDQSAQQRAGSADEIDAE